jgi:two-component system phosphate regulon sensor histidine kinase PhoR
MAGGWVVAGLAIGALFVWAALAMRERWALAQIARGLSALDEGNSARPVQGRVGGPVEQLARVFNAVAPRLEDRIDRLEGDRELLRAVLGGMSEGVIAIDGRRRLLFANEAAERLFGLGAAAVGRLVAELIRSPRIQEAVDATLTGPGAHRAEITVPAPLGGPLDQPRTLEVHGSRLPGSPPQGAVLVIHDVTETRRLERVRQDFVANASHELKTPLASIKAYAEALLEWGLHDDAVNVRFLHGIDDQADRLDRLILDLISLARLDSGQEPFQNVPLALGPVVLRCVEAQRGRAEAKRLDYALDAEPRGESSIVNADEEAVGQVLDNLIDNAIKYTPEGGRVRVELRGDSDRVVIKVADSGIGIPREDLPRVFERFYRVDKARSRELGGTGLGLAIVKHIVQSVGGEVGVESRIGFGTIFTVRLPLAGASPLAGAGPRALTAPATATASH